MPERLLFHVDLTLPHLPPHLEGLRIAHLTDLHIDRVRRRHQRIVDAVDRAEADLVFLTGDYMSFAGDELVASKVLHEMTPRLRAKRGVFAVWGNHDTPELRQSCADLPLRWLNNRCTREADAALEVCGFEVDQYTDPDSVATAKTAHLNETRAEHQAGRLVRLLLAHHPTRLTTAADMGFDIVFSGHTHGGQCRLPGGFALRNSVDFPLRLTSGILRHQDTLCVISRGLGEVQLPLRVFCPPHLPVYTLRRGQLPGERTPHIVNTRRW
jgi:uncharacterized protein